MKEFLLNIVAGFIVAIFYDFLKKHIIWLPGFSDRLPDTIITNAEQTLPPGKTILHDKAEEIRIKNREKLKNYLLHFVFYLYVFGALYYAIKMPIMFKGGLFNDGNVMLSDIKILGKFLPDIIIPKNFFDPVTSICTLLLYVPTLLLVEKCSLPVASLLNNFKRVDLFIYKQIQFFIVAIISVVYAGLVIYLFYDYTFWQSIYIAFIVAAIFAGIIIMQNP